MACARPDRARSGGVRVSSRYVMARVPAVLSPLARRVRIALTVTVVALLFYSSTVGSDDLFPFAPFKMYSYASKSNGVVGYPGVEATTADGRHLEVRAGDLGLRRAEIEGQLARFRSDPSTMAILAEAWRRKHPDGPEIVELRLYRRSRKVVDSRPVGGVREQLIATWTRP